MPSWLCNPHNLSTPNRVKVIDSECFIQGHNRHIFLKGQSNFSWFFSRLKMFFPVENSHFGRSKTNFRHFQKWKAKKKKKKSSPLFWKFSYFHFQFYTFPFTIFLLFFPSFTHFPFFSLPLFSWYVSKNFPIRSLWVALCPPLVLFQSGRVVGQRSNICP